MIEDNDLSISGALGIWRCQGGRNEQHLPLVFGTLQNNRMGWNMQSLNATRCAVGMLCLQ